MRCLVRGASAVRRFGLDCHYLLLRRLCISMNRGEDNTWKLLHAFWGGARADIVPGSQHEQQAEHFWCWLTHLDVHNCSTWTHTVHARACVAFTVRIPILMSQRSFHCPAPVRPSRRKYWATARIARYLMLARHQVIPNPTVQLQADYIRAGRPLYHATVMANVWSSLPCLAYLPALPHDCNGKCVSLRWCWTSRQARRLSSGSRLQSQLANASLPGSSVNSQCFLWSKTPKSCGMNKPSCPFYSWPSNKINII